MINDHDSGNTADISCSIMIYAYCFIVYFYHIFLNAVCRYMFGKNGFTLWMCIANMVCNM